ncbi:MAG: ATP-dependent sacrificial sulfur transferase LarE [Actinomycetota bacterium]
MDIASRNGGAGHPRPRAGHGRADKWAELVAILSATRRAVVAYSGGVDSSFLMAAAHEALGADALAVTAVSPSLARRELAGAKALAAERGWPHMCVGTHEVSREEYAQNSGDRCYWCKTELYEVLGPIAERRRAVILTGTNLDDLGDHRPGLQAARERSVRSPLVEAGLGKSEVRSLSAELGLPTADKPASPCLASRFAYGVRVTPEGLRRIEHAEEVVRGFGFEEFRVRDLGDSARIEVLDADLAQAAELESELVAGVAAVGFPAAALSRDGFRSGSLNAALLGAPTLRKERQELP